MDARTEVKPIDDLRSYIAALETRGQLHRVRAEVDWKYELCHISKVNEEQKGPALLYENVKGHSIPVFTSAFTTPERIAIALEQDPSLTMCQLSRKWMELTTKQMVKPVFVDKPPVLQNVIEGDAVDLEKFPAPWFYPDDGGRFFVTAGYLVTKDPDTGWTNLGTYRSQVLGRNILGSQIIKGKHGDMHMKKYAERGELMPAAAVVGCDPVLFLAGSTLVSAQTDEYDVAGALRGRPVPVFKSDLTGLTLPANAEIIAEGWIDPNELMEEGPFGEYTGYYSGNKGKDYPKPVLRVKRILHRNKPVFWSTTVGKPINDIHMIQSLNRTGALWYDLETMKVPGIQSVYLPAAATGRFWAVVSVKQMYPGHSNHVGNAVIASTTGHYGAEGRDRRRSRHRGRRHGPRLVGAGDALRSEALGADHRPRPLDAARSGPADRGARHRQPHHPRCLHALRVDQQAAGDLHGPRHAAEGLRPLERVRLRRQQPGGRHDPPADAAGGEEGRQGEPVSLR